MKASIRRQVCRLKREETLQKRLAEVEGFMHQTRDRTLLCELRVLRARLIKGTKPGAHTAEARAKSAAHMQEKQDASRAAAKNGGMSWSPDDERLILESPLRDEELAKLIGRSMKAITRRRAKIAGQQ